MPLPQRLVVKVNGREHEVSVSIESGVHRVEVDGESWEVLSSREREYLLKGESDSENARVHLDDPRSPSQAMIRGERCEVLVRSARDVALEAAMGGGDSGDSQLHAPMPGRVVKVLANEGDTVEAGKPLVIIEAMKMENELACPMTGKLASVAVEVGQAVDAGQLLCEIEDLPN